MTDLAAALIASLDDRALDELAERLAPRIASRLSAADASDEWLRGADEIAGYLGCPKSRVYALSSSKRIPIERDGSSLLAKRADLDAWIANGGAKRP